MGRQAGTWIIIDSYVPFMFLLSVVIVKACATGRCPLTGQVLAVLPGQVADIRA